MKQKKKKHEHKKPIHSGYYATNVRPIIEEAWSMVDDAVQQALSEGNCYEESMVDFYGTWVPFNDLNALGTGLEMALKVKKLSAAKKFFVIPEELLGVEGDLFRDLQDAMLV